MPNSVRRASGKLAISTRYKGENHPDTVEARRDWAFTNIREHVQKIVDAAPPLTPSQRARISAALIPKGGDTAAVGK